MDRIDKNNWAKINIMAKKLKAVNLLGGKCEECGENNMFCLEFHHDQDNKESIMNFIKTYRWSVIEREVSKCKILCGNCHSKHHRGNGGPSKWKTNKKIFLEFKGVNGCEKCGYKECNESLNFHHLNRNEKDFMLGNINIKFESVDDLTNKIENELNKCIVLCKNCHMIEHTDYKFFESNKNLILEKSKNLREIQRKINRSEIIEMYENGIKQVDIAKYFQASVSTIGCVIRKWKNV